MVTRSQSCESAYIQHRRLTAVILAAITVTLVAGTACLAQQKSVKTGYWTINVAYPRFNAAGPVAARANSVSKSAERDDFNSFVKEARRDVPELKKSRSNAEYALEVVPTVAADIPAISSGYVERSIYTGGANGNVTFRAYNYGLVRGSVAPITLSSLYRKKVDVIGEVSAAIIRQFRKEKRVPTSVASGGWKRLDARQAKQFVITEAGLLFLFGKSELGAGAEGPIKVVVPYADLKNYDRSGVLKPILERAAKSQLGILTTGRWVLQSILYNNDETYTSDGSGENWVEFRNGAVTGKAGINRFRGSYTTKSDGQLKIGSVAGTKAANPPGSISEQFERRISEAVQFSYKNGNLILELPYDTGVMMFRW